MSGLKEGHIYAAMKRLDEFLTSYLKISKESSQRLNDLNNSNEVDRARREARKVMKELQKPSKNAIEFACDEVDSLNQKKETITRLMSEADEIVKQASELEEKVKKIRNNSDTARDNIFSKIREINEISVYKAQTTENCYLNLDKEVHETNLLRKKVIELTEEETKAVGMLEQAADLRRQAMAKYKSVLRGGETAQEDLKTIENIAQNKQKNQNEANSYKNEIDERMKALSNVDVERFLPDGMSQINNQLNTFNKAYSGNNFQTCSSSGKALCETLKDLTKKATELKNAFDEAETNSRDHLKAAQDEFSSINIAELKRWSGKATEVESNFNDLEKASAEIEEAAKKANKPKAFSTPEAKISGAVSGIRELIQLADQNKHKFQERDALRKAIVKALKLQNYDKPVAYYNEKLPDGSPAELSDLTIYAQNPASTGDMRLKIDLDGKLGLEVFRHDKNGNEEEVTNQDAHNCHNSVNRLGEALKEAGFDFEITNWGKAEGIENTKITSRSLSFGKEPEKQQERLRERVQERNRQRY